VLQADNTTRWAWICCPSQASVTSTRDSVFNNWEKTLTKFGEWFFQCKRNNCCEVILVNQIMFEEHEKTIPNQHVSTKLLSFYARLKWACYPESRYSKAKSRFKVNLCPACFHCVIEKPCVMHRPQQDWFRFKVYYPTSLPHGPGRRGLWLGY
jgi:hypothetical protein